MDGMDEAGLKAQKLDPALREILNEGTAERVSVIVQTVDGLKEADRKMVSGLGGKVKDDLYIINAFSADLSARSIEMLILSDRVVKIFHDAEIRASSQESGVGSREPSRLSPRNS